VFRKFGGVTFHRVAPKDIEALTQCLGRAPGEYHRRLARGDIGFVAEAGGAAVSTTWMSLGKYRLAEVDYLFDPGDHGVFLYDAYTVPEWRLKGIHTNLMEFICDHLGKQTIADIYCAVEHGNDLSLRTHMRFGFMAHQTITYVRLGGFRWHWVQTVASRAHAIRGDAGGPTSHQTRILDRGDAGPSILGKGR